MIMLYLLIGFIIIFILNFIAMLLNPREFQEAYSDFSFMIILMFVNLTILSLWPVFGPLIIITLIIYGMIKMLNNLAKRLDKNEEN